MGKDDVVYICDGILLGHEKEQIGLFVEMWMDLETITQSQSEKNKYCMSMHIYAIKKNDTDEPICKL